jgi:predicted DCC family thiol-disulfide oxidoreductase YuxK
MKETFSNNLLFDGDCNLCNWAVKFVIRRDPQAKIKFAALQSEIGQLYSEKFNFTNKEIDFVIYIQDETPYIKSTAVLHLLKSLDSRVKYLYYLIFIPRFIRDFVYDIISKYRYTFFGKRSQCMTPTDDLKKRFL